VALRVEYEWQPADGVRTPELRATWARFEIWADDECITQVLDVDADSTRRSVYGSLYPFAEWIAYNWWFLEAHSRPTALPQRVWTFEKAHEAKAGLEEWLPHHNLRGAGEGLAWPDLTLVPEGEHVRIIWRSDETTRPDSSIRFTADGGALFDAREVRQVLSGLVEGVLTRLAEQGIHDTVLEEEWTDLKEADEEEVEFCLATARLGVDPFSASNELTTALELASREMEGLLFEDFVDSVDPAKIGEGVQWVESSSERVARQRGGISELVEAVRSASLQNGWRTSMPPWEIGWHQARRLRAELGLSAGARLEFESAFVEDEIRSEDRGLVALAGLSEDESPVIVQARSLVPHASRFAKARALWHLAFERDEARFLLSNAHTDRHKNERAFAAELLAPAQGIREFLDLHNDPVPEEDIQAAAEFFAASEALIRHQVENQLDLPVLAY
jgi:Zn-dependent peptidase ImmA (M78 family)